MHLPGNIINIEALLYALSQQSAPLPESLQRSLTEVGRVLQTDPSKENADRLRQVIKTDEHFENAYQQGLVEADLRYVSQERTKGMGTNFPTATELEDLDLSAFLTSYDWVNVAKTAIYSKRSQPKRSQFLLRGDRVVTLAGGGAFLGVLIFQIPGAIIGGLLAGIYAWWSFPTAKADGNN
jgi:hypothetical protein